MYPAANGHGQRISLLMSRTGFAQIIGRSETQEANRSYGLKAEIYSRVLLFGDQSRTVILHTVSISFLTKANPTVFMINYDKFGNYIHESQLSWSFWCFIARCLSLQAYAPQ